MVCLIDFAQIYYLLVDKIMIVAEFINLKNLNLNIKYRIYLNIDVEKDIDH